MPDKDITYLLQYVAEYPDIYTEVTRLLYKEFNIRGAETALLCTFIHVKLMERSNNE